MPNLITSLLARFPLGKVGAAVAVAATLVVAPLLTFSETTLKGLLDRWLSQCIVVVDITQEGTEAPIVRLYSFGDMPESLPFTFVAGKGLIHHVSFLNHVDQKTTVSESNVLVHPLANQRCPGDLCPETSEASERLTVRIKPMSSNYVYQFRILFEDPEAHKQMKVYVRPRLDEKIACRVETTTFSNFVARQSRGVQVLNIATYVMPHY
ncbi:MAG: hypothetical protein K9K30_15390 [Burkholderiaceae bacterium]|nr:hypothetical protein [Burkholderiaceae bacterium]